MAGTMEGLRPGELSGSVSMGSGGRPKMFDFISLVKAKLEKIEEEVKQQLTEELIAEQVAVYEKQLRTIVVEKVDKLTFDTIEHAQDVLSLRDEIRVHISRFNYKDIKQ